MLTRRMGTAGNGFLSHRDRRETEVFLSRIVERTIRLKRASMGSVMLRKSRALS